MASNSTPLNQIETISSVPDESELDRFAAVANKAADAAGEVIRKCFRKPLDIIEKIEVAEEDDDVDKNNKERVANVDGNAHSVDDLAAHKESIGYMDEKENMKSNQKEAGKDNLMLHAGRGINNPVLQTVNTPVDSDMLSRLPRDDFSVALEEAEENFENHQYFARNIRDIRDMYGEIEQGSSYTRSDMAWYDCRGNALLLQEANLVGIDKPKSQFQWLTDEDPRLKLFEEVKQPPSRGVDNMDRNNLKSIINDFLLKKRVILKICDGLRLAIVAIGGLLSTKGNRQDEWERIYRGLGAELEGNDKLKTVVLITGD
ncbi:hypothetical protein Vadar_016433 [Vaccinium darrowii]|uniref:Uncharacterized protein n=1 Tax=Vaccinium darrowii TaxID=229202 RepID=A0ACB7YE25_9ERIC|nr:hypothetical protein Vadar_016433 [Vaccinium darrowii]